MQTKEVICLPFLKKKISYSVWCFHYFLAFLGDRIPSLLLTCIYLRTRRKLQPVQDAAARMLRGAGKHDPAAGLALAPHELPCPILKVLALTLKGLGTGASITINPPKCYGQPRRLSKGATKQGGQTSWHQRASFCSCSSPPLDLSSH